MNKFLAFIICDTGYLQFLKTVSIT